MSSVNVNQNGSPWPSLNAAVQKDRRRYPRFSVNKSPAIFQEPGSNGKKIQAAVINWSKTGFCIETNHEIPLTQEISVPFTIKFSPSKDPTTIMGTFVRNGFTANGYSHYGVRVLGPAQAHKEQKHNFFQTLLITAFSVAVIVALVMVKLEHIQWFWYDPFFRFYTLMTAAFVATRLFFSILYLEPRDRRFFPSVSVIITVKNEEAHIAETVRCCFESHYPMDRFEVFVIDDGSTDGTWKVLEDLKPDYPQLKLIKFSENKGKRHGMAAGATAAQGEILVYVDSDSFIEREGIYRIVQPFHDASVGAVAGHTRVMVEQDNIISKMEAVRYFVSHQLFKAAESVFRTVTCCPGAFSAYRKKVVLQVLPAWLNQTFLGVRATFGDDRSLTNHILRNYDVLYHAGAVAFTYVPRTWPQFFRQQLRWKKSWARETTIAARLMPKKNALAALSYYAGIVLTLLSPIVFLRALVYGPLVLSSPVAPYLLGVFLVYLALCLFYFLHTRESHWYCGLLFAFTYMLILCWQTYYAMVTVNRTHWGTR